MKTPRLVYLAGPYTAPTRAGVEVNIRAAEDVGIEVARLGAFPVLPHANCARPEFSDVQPYTFWIDGTMALMFACEAVLMLPNYQQSPGACGELSAANSAGMPVFYSLDELKAWLT